MVDRLPSVVESIKLTFVGPMSMKLFDEEDIPRDGFIRFDGYVSYEIVGAYLIDDRVKTLVKINQFQCSELVQDYAMVSFRRELQRLILKKIPECKEHLDVCIITKLLNEE